MVEFNFSAICVVIFGYFEAEPEFYKCNMFLHQPSNIPINQSDLRDKFAV